jgi:hypothetical protein
VAEQALDAVKIASTSSSGPPRRREPLHSEQTCEWRQQRQPTVLGGGGHHGNCAPDTARGSPRELLQHGRVRRMPRQHAPHRIGQRHQLQQRIDEQHAHGREQRARQSAPAHAERATRGKGHQEADRGELEQQQRQRPVARLVHRGEHQEQGEQPKKRGARRLHILVDGSGFDSDQFGLTLSLLNT